MVGCCQDRCAHLGMAAPLIDVVAHEVGDDDGRFLDRPECRGVTGAPMVTHRLGMRRERTAVQTWHTG